MSQRVDVLVVDDRAADADVTLFALNRAAPQAKSLWLNSGDLALQFLFGSGPRHPQDEMPRLILLSQGMKGLSGPAVLDIIRCHPTTSKLRVVLIRRGDEPAPESVGAQFDPDACLRRSMDPDEFCEQMEALVARWLRATDLLKRSGIFEPRQYTSLPSGPSTWLAT